MKRKEYHKMLQVARRKKKLEYVSQVMNIAMPVAKLIIDTILKLLSL